MYSRRVSRSCSTSVTRANSCAPEGLAGPSPLVYPSGVHEFSLVTLVEQDLLTLLEHMSSPTSVTRPVTQSANPETSRDDQENAGIAST
jgi:hypothetical protein